MRATTLSRSCARVYSARTYCCAEHLASDKAHMADCEYNLRLSRNITRCLTGDPRDVLGDDESLCLGFEWWNDVRLPVCMPSALQPASPARPSPLRPLARLRAGRAH